MNLAQRLLHALKARGATEVFGIPGDFAERVPLVVLSGAPAAHEAASGHLLHHQAKAFDSQWPPRALSATLQRFVAAARRLSMPRAAA